MSSATASQAAAELRRFVPYPEYKDSGIEWLEKIPVRWEEKPFKAILSRNDSGTWGEDFDDDGVVVLRSTEQTVDGEWIIDNPARRRLSPREASDKRLKKSDLVVTKSSGSDLHIGKTSIVDQCVASLDCCFSNFMQRLRLASPNEARYFWYLLNCPVAREQLVFLSSTTTGLGNLSGSILGALRVALPAPDEQRAIAAFLDRETAKIDALVAKKERLIELLREKRTALITQAVTKGLDPSVPMKDSGVEWLGAIPAHWEAKRVKWVAKMESGHTPDKKVDAYWQDGTIPWVSLSDTQYLKENDYIAETAYFTNELGLANSSAHLLPARSVVFTRDATIGRCAITTRPMAVSQHLIAWVCYDEMLPEYLLRVFDVMADELNRLTAGATLKTIGMPEVRTLVTPVPPRDEQEKLVAWIADHSARIDILLGRVRDGVERMKEFRTALVSAAVTGKIDVREKAA